jgi:adenylate cyclase
MWEMTTAHLRKDWEAAGLYDSRSPFASERLELLELLSAKGATLEQLIEADQADGLPRFAADLGLFNLGPRVPVEKAAVAAGVSVERMARIRLASGLPVVPGDELPATSIEDVAGFELGAAFFGEGPVLAFTHVMAGAAAQVAEAALSLFLGEIEAELDRTEASELERVKAAEQGAALVDVVTGTLDHLLREHLERAVLRQRDAGSASSPTVLRLAVGFVDLADSTSWADSLEPREHAEALARFEGYAWDAAASWGGRLVKLIGDEAMFVAADPGAACRIALGLCSAAGKDTLLPEARGAVSYGDLATRGGDYFGFVANLAARATKVPRAGAVAVTEEVRASCPPSSGLRFTDIGAHQLRGVSSPVALYTVESDQQTPSEP